MNDILDGRWTQRGLSQSLQTHYTAQSTQDEMEHEQFEAARRGQHDVGTAFTSLIPKGTHASSTSQSRLQGEEDTEEDMMMAMQVDAVQPTSRHSVVSSTTNAEPLPR